MAKTANPNKNLYVITADYRPKNLNKPKYYVRAKTSTEAKRIFSHYITWLKVYSVELCSQETTAKVLADPGKYLFF